MLPRVIRPYSGLLRARFLSETHASYFLKTHYSNSTVLPETTAGFVRSNKAPQKRTTSSHDLFLRDLQKTQNDLPDVESSFDGSLESFEQYIHDPSRSVDEILSVDIRSLPAIVKLSCLEAVLNLLHKNNALSVQATLRSFENVMQANGARGTGQQEAWPQKYLVGEHSARWADWDLGINPFVLNDIPEPNWVHSPQFELLVLATAASANQLPLPRLLRLAGHFSYLWRFYDPKVFASILRLLTGQVNELGMADIFRLTSVIRDIPQPDPPKTLELADPICEGQDTSTTLPILLEEANLLRTALRLHVLSKVSGLESFDAVTLLRFIEELGQGLSKSDLHKLLIAAESSLILNPQQQSLYSLVYMCTRLSLLGTYRRGIVHRIVAQLRRKLRLAQRFPGTDQTRWLGAVVAALANLSVGAPQAVEQSVDAIELFSRPPLMPAGRTPATFATHNRHCGVDLSSSFTKEWIQEIFTDLTGYMVARPTNGSDSSRNALLEIAYALALLGYRADSILEQAYVQTNESAAATPTNCPPYIDMIELLLGSTSTNLSTLRTLNSISWLPRIEWQFYYRLAAEVDPNTRSCDSGAANQLTDYVNVKNTWVSPVTQVLQSRIHPNAKLDMSNFHRLQLDGRDESFFSDILFKKESVRSPGTTKVALCFVCHKRDLVINRPLETLLQAYRRSDARIPILVFDYSQFVHLDQPAQCEKCDTFLKEVAQSLMDSPGVSTEQLKIWTDVA